jgi:surface antigen
VLLMNRMLVTAALMLLGAASAQAFNLGFLGDSVMQRFTAQDAQLMSAAMDRALITPEEGSAQEWHNPESGASGSITLRRIYEQGGKPCRRLHTQTTAQAVTSQGIYDLCQEPNGAWTFASE